MREQEMRSFRLSGCGRHRRRSTRGEYTAGTPGPQQGTIAAVFGLVDDPHGSQPLRIVGSRRIADEHLAGVVADDPRPAPLLRIVCRRPDARHFIAGPAGAQRSAGHLIFMQIAYLQHLLHRQLPNSRFPP